MRKWQLQEAKAKLSAVIEESSKHGPQEITVRGKRKAIVISSEEYSKLTEPKVTLVDFFLNSPLRGENLDFSRNKSPGRDIDI